MNRRNNLRVVGRLTKDWNTHTFDNGVTVYRNSIAQKDDYKDQQGNWVEQTVFHDIHAYGKVGESISQHRNKGEEVEVLGQITYRTRDIGDIKVGNIASIKVEQMWLIQKPKNAQASYSNGGGYGGGGNDWPDTGNAYGN